MAKVTIVDYCVIHVMRAVNHEATSSCFIIKLTSQVMVQNTKSYQIHTLRSKTQTFPHYLKKIILHYSIFKFTQSLTRFIRKCT